MNSDIERSENQSASDDPGIDWVEILSVLWGSRRLIIYVTGAVTLLAVIVSLLLPKYYKSTVTLLPQTDQGNLPGMAGLSSLASLAGVSVGDVPLEQLYPTILTSESVLKEVIYRKYALNGEEKSFNLIGYLKIEEDSPLEDFEVALRQMRDELDISLDRKTNVVIASILTREPDLSAQILNALTAELDKFIRTKRTTYAGEQRKWIDQRLREVEGDLHRAEDSLKTFREKNRRVVDSPHLLLEQERLIREVGINTALYTELKKQLEITKIEEIKNLPIINILDSARSSGKKAKPQRRQIVLFFFLVGMIGSTCYVLMLDRYLGKITEFWLLIRARGKMRGAKHQ